VSNREIDLHGFHPYDDDLHPTIEKALREAYETEAETLTIIHGHGHNRYRPFNPFVNSNTGFLGVTVRSFLRNNLDLRRWMLAKLDVSHDGSTTVRIRSKGRAGRRERPKKRREKSTCSTECSASELQGYRDGECWQDGAARPGDRLQASGHDSLVEQLPRACRCRVHGGVAAACSERDHLCHRPSRAGALSRAAPNEPICDRGRTLGLALGQEKCPGMDRCHGAEHDSVHGLVRGASPVASSDRSWPAGLSSRMSGAPTRVPLLFLHRS
jgi:Smr domain